LYKELVDIDKAEYFFNRAISLFPENPFPYLNLADLQVSQGKYTEALVNFKKYLVIVPLDMDTIYKICGIARLADKLEDTVGEMKTFIEETDSTDERIFIVKKWLEMTIKK
jgi:Tfp pilus assembly protein PilF